MGWTEADPSLHYAVTGHGPATIVLIHEMGGSIESWAAAARLLEGDFTVVRYDQRGAGSSESPRSPLTLADQIADLEQVVSAAAGTQPIFLATTAASATIGAGFALEFPGRVAAAAFCAPAFSLDEALKRSTIERARLVMEKGMRSIVDAAMPRIYPEALRGARFPAYRARFLAHDPVAFGMANMAFADAALDLAELTIPCLLIAGGMDIRPVSAAQQAASQIRQGSVAIVEKGGHVLPDQAPEEVARLLRDFFGLQHRIPLAN